MSSGNGSSSAAGIQVLLEAEKEAAKIVAKARQYRMQRLKDAKTEAAAEIEAFKASKQAEFVAAEAGSSVGADKEKESLEASTREIIAQSNQQYESNKAAIMEKLISAVVDVEVMPNPNSNYYFQFVAPCSSSSK